MKNVFERLMGTIKEKEEYFNKLRNDFTESEQTLIKMIEDLDMMESLKIQLLEELENENNKYKDLKEELSRKKLDLRFIKHEDLTNDLNRHLNTKELEDKVNSTVKRNTVKRNVDARYGELKAELKELQSKNAKGELTSDEVTRYYLIPELLKEFDNVRK